MMNEMLRLVIDRFEGDFCICQDMETEEEYRYKKNSLPTGAAEGDVLAYKGGTLEIDEELTQNRKEEIRKLMNKLWE